MEILVSGSIAYDRIMDFSGKFSEHIVIDKIDNLNVSFMVNGLKENFGGTAGNISYCLSLLGEKPRTLSTIGHDNQRYIQWFTQNQLSTENIRIIEDEATASAYITTDTSDNQITVFNPGAMKYQSAFDFSQIDPSESIAIVAPGNLADMMEFPEIHQKQGIFTIFDPGQSLPAWQKAELIGCISQSNILISNNYELAMIQERTDLSVKELLEKVEIIITTKGEEGCEIQTKSGTKLIPAIYTDNAIDPTGAGDAFRGGLIKGLLNNLPVERAAMMGTVCSHYVVQTLGTQEYRFTQQEFTETLNQHFGS